MDGGKRCSLLHLQHATAAFGNSRMGFCSLHMRNKLPADSEGIAEIRGGESVSPRHAAASFFDCMNVEFWNQIEQIPERRSLSQRSQVTRSMIIKVDAQGIEFQMERIFVMQLAEKGPRFDDCIGENLHIGMIDEHRVFIFQAQSRRRFRANDSHSVAGELGQFAEISFGIFPSGIYVTRREHCHS